MAWKDLGQLSLVDALILEHEALAKADRVLNLINCSRIEALLSSIHSKTRGAKAFPPLLRFKALLLQSWYSLSAPGLERQLPRNLLFRRFELEPAGA